MPSPKVLVLPGSPRSGSPVGRLAALAMKELVLADAEVTRISLDDYPLPFYDSDLEVKSGIPGEAVKLKQMVGAHHAVLIITPEYNASVPPLLKNAIDWIAQVRERGDPPFAPFRERIFAVSAASLDNYGGMRALLALRQVLETGCGALVLPEQVAVAHADQAFDDMDNLINAATANQLRAMLQRLLEMARLTMQR